ncbi:prokaryotic phospholipase A2-domain-containing protein [Aspergillus pseudonomiae]|nr:prokaryotic phospholipase A2-domain-containing protein [Aspergillus pseudonomiae]
MKTSIFLIALLPAALALPLPTPNNGTKSLSESLDLQAITDELLFSIELPEFTARRGEKDPPQLDWYSDGCTKAPSNPFGFPFQRACERHDFGYQNYRRQGRFTKAAKAQIDLRFKEECGLPFLSFPPSRLKPAFLAFFDTEYRGSRWLTYLVVL